MDIQEDTTMSDESKATGEGTKPDTGAGAGAGAGNGTGQDERARWGVTEWTAEIDRRVNDAVSKREAKVRETLEAKGRDAETKLAALTAELAAAQSRATFADLATKAGVVDIAAGFVVAQGLGYFQDGKLDADAMRASHPGLFAGAVGKPAPTGAGSGSGATGAPLSFNDAVRAGAKR
jgi:hypothetical protein